MTSVVPLKYVETDSISDINDEIETPIELKTLGDEIKIYLYKRGNNSQLSLKSANSSSIKLVENAKSSTEQSQPTKVIPPLNTNPSSIVSAESPPPGPSILTLLKIKFEKVLNQVMQAMTDPDESRIALAWEALMLYIILYNYWTVLFRITFLRKRSTRVSIGIFAAFDILFDICCLMDVFFNFFRRYPGSDGIFIYESKKTAKNYVFGNKWFYVDLIATIPVDWIFIGWKPVINSFIRLLKLARLMKMNVYWRDLQTHIVIVSNTLVQVVKFITYSFMVTHLMTVLWFLVVDAQEEPIAVAWTLKEDILHIHVMSQYLVGFYWCITSMTGYGGTNPASFLQVFYGEFMLLVGTVMYVLLIGTVGSLVVTSSSNQAKGKQKMDQMREYMAFRNIPKPLQDKIRDYYNFVWKTRKGWDETIVLEDLPNYLRMEIALDINRELIEKVPLFKDRSKMFISSVVMSLVPRVTLPGSIIVRKGEIGREMFFISSGSVEIISDSDPPIIFATLGTGQFFGEIAIVFEQRRGATVRAATFCDLYVLTKDSLEAIALDYPDQVEAIKQVAKERLEAQSKQQANPPPPSTNEESNSKPTEEEIENDEFEPEDEGESGDKSE